MTTTTDLYSVRKGYTNPLCTVDLFGRYQCSNGGLSAKFSEAFLFPAGTLASEIDPRQLPQAVTINLRDIGGPVFSLEPVDQPANAVGPMAGGYYGSSDSRLSDEARRIARAAGYDRTGFYGAMALHDRFETPAQYRANY